MLKNRKIQNQPIRKRDNSHFEISQSELRTLIKKPSDWLPKTNFQNRPIRKREFSNFDINSSNRDISPKNRKF